MTRAYYDVATLLLVCYLSTVASQNLSITADCNGPTTPTDSEIYSQFLTLKASTTLTVSCIRLRPETAFIIFQVHSYLHNVTLYQGQILPNTSFVGTNLGMYNRHSDKTPTHAFSIANYNKMAVQVYISVHGYMRSDPIPGGCNLVDPVEVDPTLEVRHADDVIRVLAAPGNILDTTKCGAKSNPDDKVYIVHSFYRLFLTERDFSDEEYFGGIRKMLTVGKILKYGVEVPSRSAIDQLIRTFSLYPGTGSVYATVVHTPFGQAVYVPAFTYGCSLTDSEDTCDVFSGVLPQVICALMFFTGLFICYFGHRFFKTEMFLAGLLAGVIVTYIVMSQVTAMEPSALLGAALLSGACAGAAWWLFWWLYGAPALSVMLATLQLGFLGASLLMFTLPDDADAMSVNATFWTIFWIVTLFFPISLLCVTFHANLLCCAVLGAYATVYPIDHYLGSNLKYVVINTVRRATVPGFQAANVAVPYQWRDTVTTLLWIALATSGFLYQRRQNRNKPPFPPPPRETLPTITPGAGFRRMYTEGGAGSGVRRSGPRVIDGERTPLLN